MGTILRTNCNDSAGDHKWNIEKQVGIMEITFASIEFGTGFIDQYSPICKLAFKIFPYFFHRLEMSCRSGSLH